jgi:hypothetical protein
MCYRDFLGSQANNEDISGDPTFRATNNITFHTYSSMSCIGLSCSSSQKLNATYGTSTPQESPITSSPEAAALLELVVNRFLLNEESIDMSVPCLGCAKTGRPFATCPKANSLRRNCPLAFTQEEIRSTRCSVRQFESSLQIRSSLLQTRETPRTEFAP